MATTTPGSLNGRRVLVLNASYEPVKVIGWKRAMLLWLAEKVDVIEHHDVSVHSVTESFGLPSVIRVRQYIKRRRRGRHTFKRTHIFNRDDYCCQYCAVVFPQKDLTLDHVVPVKSGGPKTWENLVTCCRDCNQRKGARTPDEAGMPLLTNPRRMPVNYIPDLILLRKNMPENWKVYLGQLLSF
ncbi:HNH endonuclease [bacterium]|nr:HNH endonuclease [bacterium]